MTLWPGRAGKASGSFSRCLLRLPPLITGGVHGAAEPMNNSSLSFPAPKRRDLCRSSRGMKAPAGSGEGPGRSRLPDPFPISRALELVPRLHTRPCSPPRFQAGEIPLFPRFWPDQATQEWILGLYPGERLGGLGWCCFGCTTPPLLQNPVLI